MNSDTPTPPAPAGLHETTLDLVNEAAIRTIHASPLFERKLAAHLAAVDAKLKECEEEKGEVLRKHAISSLEALTYFHEKHETEQQRDRLQRENEALRDATILLQTARDDAYEERDALYDAFSELAKLVKQDDGADPETFWIELDRDQAQMIREVAKKAAALSTGRERT